MKLSLSCRWPFTSASWYPSMSSRKCARITESSEGWSSADSRREESLRWRSEFLVSYDSSRNLCDKMAMHRMSSLSRPQQSRVLQPCLSTPLMTDEIQFIKQAHIQPRVTSEVTTQCWRTKTQRLATLDHLQRSTAKSLCSTPTLLSCLRERERDNQWRELTMPCFQFGRSFVRSFL